MFLPPYGNVPQCFIPKIIKRQGDNVWRFSSISTSHQTQNQTTLQIFETYEGKYSRLTFHFSNHKTFKILSKCLKIQWINSKCVDGQVDKLLKVVRWILVSCLTCLKPAVTRAPVSFLHNSTLVSTFLDAFLRIWLANFCFQIFTQKKHPVPTLS